MINIKTLINLVRLPYWSKNLVICLPIIFNDISLTIYPKLLPNILLFSLCCSVVYILNDLIDYKYDKNHPNKKNRPLASDDITKKTAINIMFFLISIIFLLSFYIPLFCLFVLLIYFFINICYSLWLKKIFLLDIAIISFGFVLRYSYGVFLLNTPFSYELAFILWLLCIYILLTKRYRATALVKNQLNVCCNFSKKYKSTKLLRLISCLKFIIISNYIYLFYTSIYTIFLVIMGLQRYSVLAHNRPFYYHPLRICVTDVPLLMTTACWVIMIKFF